MSNTRKIRPSTKRRRLARDAGTVLARVFGCTCTPTVTERHDGPREVMHLVVAHDLDCPACDAPTTLVPL